MADFSPNATQLSGPQGQGTAPIAPVQQQANTISLVPMLGGVIDAFVSEKQAYDKRKKEEFKNGVLKEYMDNENKYVEATRSGQWDSSRAASASRANYQKFLASNPGLINELKAARSEVYSGTETSEIARKEQEAHDLEKQMIQDATKMGYQFHPGMSEEAKKASLNAFQSSRALEANLEKSYKQNAELRAQRSDIRADDDHVIKMSDYQLRNTAIQGLTEVASANFDAILASGKDLSIKVNNGTMNQEDARIFHQANMARIDATILQVARTNPELAAPYRDMFSKMDLIVKDMLDPSKKSDVEVKAMKNRLDLLVTTQKVLALEKDPQLLKAYTATSLFPGDVMVEMAGKPAVANWMLAAGQSNPNLSNTNRPIGHDDKELFNLSKKALSNLQSGKIAPDKLEAATQEANNVVNQLLKQTAGVDGNLDPAALKNASAFYASTEFGKMAMAGKIDKETATNVQHVFQVKYEPAVKAAILKRMEVPSAADPSKSLLQTVNIDFQGSGVKFSNDVVAERKMQHRGSGSPQVGQWEQVDQLKDAEAGLNQLIRMHAHLEGTTDYKKYWEDNKHVLMPGVFPDPAVLKPGQVADGHKYIGGNYRNPANWIREPESK